MSKLTAPFTPEQVKNLRAWQASDYVHPFTCCDHQTMTVETDGFHCPKCGEIQTWCHDFMANGLIPNWWREEFQPGPCNGVTTQSPSPTTPDPEA